MLSKYKTRFGLFGAEPGCFFFIIIMAQMAALDPGGPQAPAAFSIALLSDNIIACWCCWWWRY